MKSLLRIAFVPIIFLLFSHDLFSQERIKKRLDETEGRHYISLNASHGYVPRASVHEDGSEAVHYVPGIGLDYLLRLDEHWELGLLLDMELTKYYIQNREILVREKAFIVAGSGVYTFDRNWSAFLGAGIEFEKHKNLPILRFGAEYNINLRNQWSIPLGAFTDVKKDFVNYSLSIGIGKNF